MYQSELNSLAETYVEDYLSIQKLSSKFEPKGIFHSELLMVLALSQKLNIKHIIESGRARGQSTEIIARICQKYDIKFDSIEFDQNSPDVVVAENRLKPFAGVCTLHYGDALSVMPGLITEHDNTMIIIDGPKGVLGLKLGLSMLRNSNVKAVLFHDSHRDASDVRPLLERYFPNNLLFSDDYEYVEKFRNLDIDCWEITEAYTGGYGPYKRKDKPMRSYAGTLSCVLNNSMQSGSLNSCLIDIDKEITRNDNILFKLLKKNRIIAVVNRLRQILK